MFDQESSLMQTRLDDLVGAGTGNSSTVGRRRRSTAVLPATEMSSYSILSTSSRADSASSLLQLEDSLADMLLSCSSSSSSSNSSNNENDLSLSSLSLRGLFNSSISSLLFDNASRKPPSAGYLQDKSNNSTKDKEYATIGDRKTGVEGNDSFGEDKQLGKPRYGTREKRTLLLAKWDVELMNKKKPDTRGITTTIATNRMLNVLQQVCGVHGSASKKLALASSRKKNKGNAKRLRNRRNMG